MSEDAGGQAVNQNSFWAVWHKDLKQPVIYTEQSQAFDSCKTQANAKPGRKVYMLKLEVVKSAVISEEIWWEPK
jgi:hypothetical protein